jgi:hypothetical protein
MKKLVLTVVALAMLAGTAMAADKTFRASVSPQLGVIGKIDSPAGTDIRRQNFNLDSDVSIELWKGLGLGANFIFMPGKFEITGITEGNLDVMGLSFGPRYFYALSDNWELYGYLNAGWYRTEVAATVFGVLTTNTENDWGINGGAGVNYNYKKLTVGFKAGTHYARNASGGDDMMIWTFGPTIGVRF